MSRPRDDTPSVIRIGDFVEASIKRLRYVKWIVRNVSENEDGQIIVVASKPGVGSVLFLWLRGLRWGEGHGLRFYYAGRPEVKPESLWRHKNGLLYRVLFITNNTTPLRPDHPPDVVYEAHGRFAARKYSLPLSDWHRSFSPE